MLVDKLFRSVWRIYGNALSTYVLVPVDGAASSRIDDGLSFSLVSLLYYITKILGNISVKCAET